MDTVGVPAHSFPSRCLSFSLEPPSPELQRPQKPLEFKDPLPFSELEAGFQPSSIPDSNSAPFLSVQKLLRRPLPITTDKSQFQNHFRSFRPDCQSATTAATIYFSSVRKNDIQVVSQLVAVWTGKISRIPAHQFSLRIDSEAVVFVRSTTGKGERQGWRQKVQESYSYPSRPLRPRNPPVLIIQSVDPLSEFGEKATPRTSGLSPLPLQLPRFDSSLRPNDPPR